MQRDIGEEARRRMSDELSASLVHLAVGERRWQRSSDLLAGQAAALHARALIEFLAGTLRGRDARNVVPSDLSAWAAADEDVIALLAALPAVEAQLAPLALDRAAVVRDDPPGGWRALVDRILDVAGGFAASVPDEHGGAQLRLAVDQARGILDAP